MSQIGRRGKETEPIKRFIIWNITLTRIRSDTRILRLDFFQSSNQTDAKSAKYGGVGDMRFDGSDDVISSI